MLHQYLPRIISYQNKLECLLNAPSIRYSEWPTIDKKDLRSAAGIYHFFEVAEGCLRSVYVGRAGFGRQSEKQTWSLYSRLSQHFLPSQKNTLLGKASKKMDLPSNECKSMFLQSNLQVQWLALHETCPRRDLNSELFGFEYFAISVLRPEYTDG